jgi:hypothetical protein
MSATYNKFNQTSADFAHAVHKLSTTATLKFMLANTLPTSSMATSTDITQISSGNGYSGGALGGVPVTVTSAIQSSGTFTLQANNAVLTASGGSIGPFRYSVLYNPGSTSIATGPLLGWFDYGLAITLNDTDTFTISS